MLKNNGFHNRHSPFSRPFSPASFFANGEQGWWYDPSNFATLFQDSAGTTPVTAVEQPVGLQLDLSKGLVLGPETIGAFLTAGYWSIYVAGVTFPGSSMEFEVSPDRCSAPTVFTAGKTYRCQVTFASTGNPVLTLDDDGSGGGAGSLTQYSPNGGLVSGVPFYFRATTSNRFRLLQAGTGTASVTGFSVRELPGNHRFQTTSANRPVVSARVNLFVGTATLATQSVTTRATTHTLTFTGAGSITLSGTATGTYTAGTHLITTTAGSLTATVSGTVTQADLRETNVGVGLPAYQAVVTSTNYDSTGFPTYIKPNGTNQWMQTNSINFTATDKMTVWQGVRKLSDAVLFAILAEPANGAFALQATSSVTGTGYRTAQSGAAAATSSGLFVAPITNVFTALFDATQTAAANALSIRINGAAVSPLFAGVSSISNFGNNPVYFYARGGTSVFFGGNDYGSIARGAASTAAQITNGETYINSLTKAYAP